MSTRFSHDLTYDAPMADVDAMLMDPDFRTRACQAQGAIRQTVSIGEDSDGVTVVVDQVQNADGIPGFARKFVGDEINLVQTETWHDAENARVEVVIPGKPGEMTGTINLSESGGVTTERVEMEIKVNIPLVGGKIENLIADLLRKALKSENAEGRDYLSS
ncbi:DUF2505 domain-containing protein [Nocardioides dilutus]